MKLLSMANLGTDAMMVVASGKLTPIEAFDLGAELISVDAMDRENNCGRGRLRMRFDLRPTALPTASNVNVSLPTSSL
jgi:hypothetical protein